MNRLFVADENAELRKYFAEWPKTKKLFRFIILGSLYLLMVALVTSSQKVAFCSFYVMPFQNTFWYWGNLVAVFLLTFAPFCLLFEKPHYFSITFFIPHLYVHISEWLPKQ